MIHTRYQHVLIVLMLAILRATPLGAAPAHSSKMYIVVIDLSASRSQSSVYEDEAFLRSVAEHFSFGDQFVVLQVKQSGVSDATKRFSVVLPSPRDPAFINSRDQDRLKGSIKGIDALLPSFFKPLTAEKILHTDLFTTLSMASEFTRDRANRPVTLILLSDMLQSANGVEMEHLAHMPPAGWIQDQERLHILPSLKGTCVLVVGADDTTRDGAAIRSFWQRYFAAAHASLPAENYRFLPPSEGLGSCH